MAVIVRNAAVQSDSGRIESARQARLLCISGDPPAGEGARDPAASRGTVPQIVAAPRSGHQHLDSLQWDDLLSEDSMISHMIADGFPDAILRCDRGLVVDYRNAAARTLLDVCPLIQIKHDRLSFSEPHARRFVQAICQTIDRAQVLTFAIESDAYGRHMVCIGPAGEARAFIQVRNIARYVHRKSQMAADQYGLTSAEQSLLRSLLEGFSLEQHAAGRDLRISTVRSQLSALLGKTGAKRQADLVSLVMTSPDGIGPVAETWSAK